MPALQNDSRGVVSLGVVVDPRIVASTILIPLIAPQSRSRHSRIASWSEAGALWSKLQPQPSPIAGDVDVATGTYDLTREPSSL